MYEKINKEYIKDNIIQSITQILNSSDISKNSTINQFKAWRFRCLFEKTMQLFLGLKQNEFYRESEYLQHINNHPKLCKVKDIKDDFVILYRFFGKWSHYRQEELSENELINNVSMLLQFIENLIDARINLYYNPEHLLRLFGIKKVKVYEAMLRDKAPKYTLVYKNIKGESYPKFIRYKKD